MPLVIQHYIRSICVVIFLIAKVFTLYGQDQKVEFTWRNGQKKVCKAVLKADLVPESTRGLYKLSFSVEWFDAQGIQIQTESPYLYLSKYYLNLNPGTDFTCLTFAEANKTDLLFQNLENIFLTCNKQGINKLTVSAQFRYALTFRDYQDGRMAEIGIDGNNVLEFQFTVSVKPEDKVIGQDDTLNISNPNTNAPSTLYNEKLNGDVQLYEYRYQGYVERHRNDGQQELIKSLRQQGDFTSLSDGVKDSLQKLVNEGLRQVDITIRELDEFIGELEIYKSDIQKDSIPVPLFTSLSDRLNKVLQDNRNLRSTYTGERLELTGFKDLVISTEQKAYTDSLVEVAKTRYVTIFNEQLDSLEILKKMHQQVSDELQPFLSGPRGKAIGNSLLDSLRGLNSRIGVVHNQLRQHHNENWSNYRYQIEGLGITIPEVETVHSRFTQEDYLLDSSLRSKNNELQNFDLRISTPGIFSSKWVLWIGSGFIVVFLIFWLVWAIRRTERKSSLAPGLGALGLDPANGGMVAGYMVDSDGVLDPVAYEEYYKIHSQLENSETVIESLYVHFGVIKSIYQLVHGALMSKNPTDFGGLLFGSYYRIMKGKTPRFELLIDRIVPTKSIRAAGGTTPESGVDIVDEMDAAVKENKKYLLMGWFSSSRDATMIMPDPWVKIHRNFFKEKWQIAIMVHPGSDDLRSAIFLRRKTGFFDPIPDPMAMIQWDELYNYALNPPRVDILKSEVVRKPLDSYLQVNMTAAWSDSVIHQVCFDPVILDEIRSVVDLQDLMNEGFKISGFLYGHIEPIGSTQKPSFNLFVERFIESQNGNKAREIPGFRLIGWWGSGHKEMDQLLVEALPYHEEYFKESYQISCLENAATGEFRILSRKPNMEMNNNVIETEEFNLPKMISLFKKD